MSNKLHAQIGNSIIRHLLHIWKNLNYHLMLFLDEKKKLCRIWFHEYFFRIFERIVKPSRRRRDQTEITELLNLWHELRKKIANSQIRPSYHISIAYIHRGPPEAIEKSCEGHNQANNNLNLQTKTKGE